MPYRNKSLSRVLPWNCAHLSSAPEQCPSSDVIRDMIPSHVAAPLETPLQLAYRLSVHHPLSAFQGPAYCSHAAASGCRVCSVNVTGSGSVIASTWSPAALAILLPRALIVSGLPPPSPRPEVRRFPRSPPPWPARCVVGWDPFQACGESKFSCKRCVCDNKRHCATHVHHV